MSINLSVPESPDIPELKPRITVIGVGGAGGNAVNNMIAANLEGCGFVVANTDSQALAGSKADHRIQMGTGTTRGLGAGSKPEVGRKSAEESLEEVISELDGSNMVFIAAGMGGGTGTGAAPVIARAARERGILTVGVVTKPFQFEGAHRARLADAGTDELAQFVDTLIIIPNQNLFRVANEKTTFADAFRMADDVLYSGVRSITDLMVMPGLINLDFADVQSVMAGMGRAMMGTGEAEGDRRAIEAAEAAISNPLLDDASMKGARGVLINITGGPDITLFEVDEAANRVRSEVDEDAYIIIGSAFDETMEGRMRVSVVATGLNAQEGVLTTPESMTSLLAPAQRPEPVRVPRPAAAETVLPDLTPATATPQETVEETGSGGTVEATADDLDGDDLERLEDVDDMIEEVMETEPEVQAEVSADPTPEPRRPETPTEIIAKSPSVAPVGAPREGALDAFVPSRRPEIPVGPKKRDPIEAPMDATPTAETARREEPATGKTSLIEKLAKKPRLSLFDKVTRGDRGESATPVEAVAQPKQSSPSLFGGGTAKGPSLAEARTPSARIETGKTASLNAKPEDRPQASEPDEDLLDIPTFLRRQAN